MFEICRKTTTSEPKDTTSHSLQGREVILISDTQLCQAKKPLHTELNCIWELESHRLHCHFVKGRNPVSDTTEHVRIVHYISEVQVIFAYLFCYQQQVSLSCPLWFIHCHYWFEPNWVKPKKQLWSEMEGFEMLQVGAQK